MYIQIKEAAAQLKMSRQWLHHLINEGQIGTSVMAGRRVVVDDERFKALRKERAKAGK